MDKKRGRPPKGPTSAHLDFADYQAGALNPTKYEGRFAYDLIDWGKRGGSLHSFGPYLNRITEGRVKAHYAGIMRWAENYPCFSEALKYYRDECFSFWEQKGFEGLHDRSFNVGVFALNLRNRFGWGDKDGGVEGMGAQGILNLKDAELESMDDEQRLQFIRQAIKGQ